MSSRRHRAPAFAAAPGRRAEPCDRDQHRHHGDIEDLKACAETVNACVQVPAHFAQRPANAQLLVLEPGQFRFLLGAEQQAVVIAPAHFELAQLALGLLEFELEALLLRAQAGLGLPAQLVNALEGAAEAAAAAYADQVAAASQVVQRIGNQRAVVREGLGHALTEQAANLHPEPVRQQVGVGEDQ